MGAFGYNPANGQYTGDGTDDWTELARPFELKTRRATGAQPGSIEVVIPGTSVASADVPPVWIFQRIKLEDLDIPVNLRRMFIGRVDSVAPRQDPTYGRVWVIKARDYLAALSDNHVDVGKNRAYVSQVASAGGLDTRGGVRTGVFWRPRWIEKDEMEEQDSPTPGETEDCPGSGESCGTYRYIIISELALNIVPLPFGLHSVIQFNPGSRAVQYNLADLRSRRILDVITDVAGEDPWKGEGSSLVDSRTADGIGAEFQVLYSDSANAWVGQRAQYFRRGNFLWDDSITFAYGEVSAAGFSDIRSIIGYDFPQEGHDLFSRAKTVGRGEAQDTDLSAEGQTAGWGSGLVLSNPQIEGAWNPEDGEFAVMRGIEEQELGIVGDLRFDPTEIGVGDPNPLEARALRDRAASKMPSFSTNPKLRLQARGLRGMIRVPGYPRNDAEAGLIIGLIINVRIPQVFGDVTQKFIIESWEFKYPENITTIQLAMRASSTMGQIFGGWERRQDQSWGSHSEWTESKWKVSSGDGIELFVHRLGVPPRTIIVEVARDSGKFERGGVTPIPDQNTITEAPRLANEPAQGQNFGYVVHRSDRLEFEYGLAYWIADSSGAGDWLRDGTALVRVRVRS